MNTKEFLFGSLPESNSAAGSLNPLDWKKTVRGLVVVMAGALATAGFDFLLGWLNGTDFGQYQILVVMVVNSGLLELGRRYVSSHLPK